MRRRPIVTMVAMTVVAALVAAGCTQDVDTAEVGADGPTTTARARATSRAAGSAATGPAPTAPRPAVAGLTAANSEQAQAALDLITRIAQDPAGFARANGLSQEQIARQLGVSPEVLRNLQLDPGTVGALASLFRRLDPASVSNLASGKVNPQLVATVVELFGLVNPQSVAGLNNIDPRALSVLVTASQAVDPKIIEAVGSIVAVSDPGGLGKLAGDKNSLALLTLLFGVALRTDPTQFRELSALNNLAPGFQFALDGITSIVNAFDPKTVEFINQINKNFSPELLATLSGITSALNQPDIQAVLNEASKNPENIATAVAVAALLIPGLAEAIDPNAFGANPNAANQALVALLLLALARANGIDVSAFTGG
ncbi:MAG: hypothetical protein ACKO04_02660 [Actinomycetes bacterium]